MPRGVYDRSKTKEQRAAEKTGKEKKAAKAAAPKRKYTRRAVASVEDTSPAKFSAPKSSGPDNTFLMMGEIRNNLATLSLVRDKFGEIGSVTTEAEAQILALGRLRENIFGDETDNVVIQEDDVVAQNGVTTPIIAPAHPTVPLPPPLIPTPH